MTQEKARTTAADAPSQQTVSLHSISGSNEQTHEKQKKAGGSSISYPRRLIEVDLPIKRISAHSGREKSVRSGHISTLHIWWARRPLAACRAVICASLWPDPVDVTEADAGAARKDGKELKLNTCPTAFREKAKAEMLAWTSFERQKLLSEESRKRFEAARKNPNLFDSPLELRGALLDFIADFANWDNSTVKEFLETSHILTKAAHASLNNIDSTKPIIVDPFAGGGAFPIEAARVGGLSYAGDYNILAWTINHLELELLPKANGKLADLLKEWGTKFLNEAENRLSCYYPEEPNGDAVVAYLWARTISCEGPGCGVDVPILKSTVLGTKNGKPVAIEIEYNDKKLLTKIINTKPKISGTSKRSSVTCPHCGYTTPRPNVAKQAIERGFGYHLYAVGYRASGATKTQYRTPEARDFSALDLADKKLRSIETSGKNDIIPSEELPYLRSIFNVRVYGIDQWRKLFTNRQLISALEYVEIYSEFSEEINSSISDENLRRSLLISLALCISNALQYQCNISTWLSESVKSAFIQGQSLPMKMDFVEANPLFKKLAGGLEYAFQKHLSGIEYLESYAFSPGEAHLSSATSPFMPEDSTDLVVTDPPYYDVVPYADCSDFFNVWLHRLFKNSPEFRYISPLSSKEEEIVQLAERNEKYRLRTKDWFEKKLTESLEKWRVAVKPDGRMVMVFAHKQTSAWEALLNSVLNAGWVVTASWPLDTENAARMRANDSAVLTSSVHLVCRPRENQDGSISIDEIGDWRDVLQELPRRIHEWMPRLAEEGVVGADAIFACLGPALEIFSRYSRVEKASGETVTLREYLEQVWAAVAREALSMVFSGADTAGFEPDARMTAMWLWTLNAGAHGNSDTSEDEDENNNDDDEETSGKKAALKGFVLEYDAARKIAQGLGASLDTMSSLVEVKGDKARLLPVAERTQALFGKEGLQAPAPAGKKKKDNQLKLNLFDELMDESKGETVWQEKVTLEAGETVLDRVHQSMILFAAGRSEAMRRFLVDDGAGRDQRFWRLAQALSALYPASSEEKRWVDGVLARKKGLGL